MSEMVDRVAAAVAQVMDDRPLVNAAPEVVKRLRAERIARVAIDAMRKPTDEMVAGSASARPYPRGHGQISQGEAKQIYAAMIDAALKPGR